MVSWPFLVSEAQPKAFTPARPDQPCHPRHLPIHPSMCTEHCWAEPKLHSPTAQLGAVGRVAAEKSSDITLLTKICLVIAMAFPVVMYEHERWTIKKAESQRIDAFEL